jgi:L-threonylcarbamoyladenylate synthase
MPLRGIRKNKLLEVNPDHPDPEIIRLAGQKIREGGVIVFPTQCLYGLGADARNAEAVARIFAIKQRAPTNPLLILIPGRSDLASVTDTIPLAAKRIMDVFWPGNVTLLFEANPSLPASLTAGTGKIGVRLPLHPVAAELVRKAGGPITGTSANLSGFPGAATIDELGPDITGQVDLILDAGVLKGGIGSTIVDITVVPPLVLREGAITAKIIFKALSRPQQ